MTSWDENVLMDSKQRHNRCPNCCLPLDYTFYVEPIRLSNITHYCYSEKKYKLLYILLIVTFLISNK